MLVKDYQEAMGKKNFIISNEENINEITTFVKHITPSGNIRYAADIGNDDTVMTLINGASVFSKYEFREMVEDYANKNISNDKLLLWNSYIKQVDYVEGIDYSSIIKINKQRKYAKEMKNLNGRNWY